MKAIMNGTGTETNGSDTLTEHMQIIQQFFAHSNDALMICDTEGEVLFVNAAFSRLYGYREREVVGRPSSLIRHNGTPSGLFSQMWQDIQNPGVGFWKGEIRNSKKDGAAVEVMLTITALKDKEGETIAYMSIALDVTDKKHMEKKLIEREKLSSIGLLASGIAHEIGSPLNVISGRAEMIKTQLRDRFPEAEKSLAIIVQQTDRISDLVKGLLNFSRPTGRSTPDTFSEIDMTNVLDECGKLLNKPMQDLGVNFSVSRNSPACIRWDFHKCEQVFINLLQNALHAVEDTANPEIGVVFRPMNKDELESLPDPAEDGLAVEVCDNGSGIPEDQLGRVFDPFFTTKAPGMGTGLGLSVVYGLVKEIQGALKVDSAIGTGTTFTLLLPAGLPEG